MSDKYTAGQMLATIPCLEARDMYMEADMFRQAAQMMREREVGGAVARVQRGADRQLYAMILPGKDDSLHEGQCLYTARRAAVPDGWRECLAQSAAALDVLGRRDLASWLMRVDRAMLAVATESPSRAAVPDGWTERTFELIHGVEELFSDDSNGPGYWQCPICDQSVHSEWQKGRPINPGVAHDSDCPVHIRKHAAAPEVTK